MTASDSPDRLAEIRARVEAATPGPWELVEVGDNVPLCVEVRIGFAADDVVGANNVFVTHARTDIPWLLAELNAVNEARRAAEAEVERLRSENAAHVEYAVAVQKQIAMADQRADSAEERFNKLTEYPIKSDEVESRKLRAEMMEALASAEPNSDGLKARAVIALESLLRIARIAEDALSEILVT
jgi:hypothetical protein